MEFDLFNIINDGSKTHPAECLTEVPRWQMVDKTTYQTAEVGRLLNSVPTSTLIGRQTLNNHMTSGAGELDIIEARQDALEELESKPDITEAIQEQLVEIGENELDFANFLSGRYPALSAGEYFKAVKKVSKAVSAIGRIGLVDSTEVPETPYLKNLFSQLKDYSETEFARMMDTSIHYTLRGLRAKEDVPVFAPRLKHIPRMITGRFAIPFMAAFAASLNLPLEVRQQYAGLMVMPTILAPMLMIYGYMPNKNAAVNTRMSKRFTGNENAVGGFKTIGVIDELIALNGFKQFVSDNGYEVCRPELSEDSVYRLQASKLRNPLLATRSEFEVVPNDITIGTNENDRLTFLTGPNSGGKSTLSKALILNQILGQIGGPVVASEAQMSMADRVAYHVPTPPDLEEDTGRFGYELKQVRDILDRASAKSLTVLDDCLDGTTHEERMEVLKTVLLGFRNLGGSTMFSTHAHELVEVFEERGVGQFLQVEFDGEKPTHKIKPGVSHTSHAASVAKEHGFDNEKMHMKVLMSVDEPVWF